MEDERRECSKNERDDILFKIGIKEYGVKV
jgi:hypothetical protein